MILGQSISNDEAELTTGFHADTSDGSEIMYECHDDAQSPVRTGDTSQVRTGDTTARGDAQSPVRTGDTSPVRTGDTTARGDDDMMDLHAVRAAHEARGQEPSRGDGEDARRCQDLRLLLACGLPWHENVSSL